MKSLTKEEAQKLKKKPDGKSSYARGVLLNMNKGDIILMEPKDWKRKHMTPKTYCLQLGRKTKREWKCEELMDGTGWVIERIR